MVGERGERGQSNSLPRLGGRARRGLSVPVFGPRKLCLFGKGPKEKIVFET